MTRHASFKRVREFINPVQEVINQLVNDLFAHEIQYINQTFEKLVIENQSLGGTMNVFLYDGEYRSHLPHHLVKGVKNVREVQPTLYPAMQKHLERVRAYERDKRFVLNAFSVVGQKCNSIQDMRDVLPEPLVAEVPSLKRMERMREEGWLLFDNPLLLRQFREAVEIVLYYKVNRLIY
jgi:hypothetical protein